MTRYAVPLTTWANTTVEVEAPDSMTDPEQIAELALEQIAEAGGPDLCHQCAGSRRGSPPLGLGDEWEVSRYDGDPDITRLDD